MAFIAVALLVAAAGLVIATEWPRLSVRVGLSGRFGSPRRFSAPARKSRERAKRKSKLRVVPDHEEFERAVQRDLASLPTIDEKDAKRR